MVKAANDREQIAKAKKENLALYAIATEDKRLRCALTGAKTHEEVAAFSAVAILWHGGRIPLAAMKALAALYRPEDQPSGKTG